MDDLSRKSDSFGRQVKLLRDRQVEHPHIVLFSAGTSQPFGRAKPSSCVLELVPERDRQRAARRLCGVYERQRVAIPV
jgi:hypothetical protein